MAGTPRLRDAGTPASLRASRTPGAALSAALSGKRRATPGTGGKGDAMSMSPVPLSANGRVVLGDVGGGASMAPPKRRWSVSLSAKKAAEAEATDAAAKDEDEENAAEVPMSATGKWSPEGAKVQVRKNAGHRTPHARSKKKRLQSPGAVV